MGCGHGCVCAPVCLCADACIHMPMCACALAVCELPVSMHRRMNACMWACAHEHEQRMRTLHAHRHTRMRAAHLHSAAQDGVLNAIGQRPQGVGARPVCMPALMVLLG